MKAYEDYEKNERIAKILSIVSVTGIATGITFAVLSAVFEKDFLGTISIYGLTVFVVPVLALQVAMPMNWHTYGIKSLGKVPWVFFLVAFPFADMWFFCGIDALYDIVPNFHLIEDRGAREVARVESMTQAWTYIGIIYASLVGTGFFLRNFKNFNKRMMIA